ncbi:MULTISPECIES: hypothetical protein [Actinosynnema]|uniref:hypothetical protein n=1 Tax=Actinosynnema TaxID=40566 RepID=UPI0020A48EE7|nr:hypothetical protein [Actinosynnema pretiosum]MCP2094182.1 hypothetical protein [Actinosynnema pretiosum]
MPTTTEVRLAIMLGGGSAVAFVLVAALQLLVDPASASLVLPVAVAVIELGVVAGLWKGVRPARIGGMAVFLLFGLVHLLVVLGPTPVWVRLASAVIAAAHVFVAVLLNTRPARDHFSGAS